MSASPAPSTTTTTADTPTQTGGTTTTGETTGVEGEGNKRQKRPKARALTHDEAVEIRALRKYAKWTHDQIVAATPFTINQVQSACKAPRKGKRVDRWTTSSLLSSSVGGDGGVGVGGGNGSGGVGRGNGGGSVGGSETGSV